MKKPLNSRFFQRPATKIGWWSAVLATLAMVMLILNNFGLTPFTNIRGEMQTALVTAWDLIMLGSMLTAIVLGIIAVTSKRERSWLVWLFMIPVTFLMLLLIAFSVEYLKFTQERETKDPTMSGGIDHTEAAPTPVPGIERTPVFFDDDGSPDGTTALLYLLSDPQVEVVAVSISYGEAHPQIYIQYLGRVMEQYGYGDVPLGAGQDAPLEGDNAFPDFVRDPSNDFWGFARDGEQLNYPVQDSAEMMIRLANQSDKPVTFFISGTLTNLAKALRLDPGIAENIAAVYIMGGAVNVPGNITGLVPDSKNQVAEWNIYADPLAAAEVFSSGLPLYLVPLDATNQVILTREDIRSWRKGGSLPNFAADFYETRMNDWGRDQIEMWDLVTAEIMMNPQHCQFSLLKLEVITDRGVLEGQTKVVEGETNVNVCLQPDSDAIKSNLEEVFGSRK